MKYNADGSLTLYLQADSPGKEKESNWLPAPKGPFLVILGTYAPGEALVESRILAHTFLLQPLWSDRYWGEYRLRRQATPGAD
jgi:hypothetical protein